MRILYPEGQTMIPQDNDVLRRFQKAAAAAAHASIEVIRPFQTGERVVTASELKPFDGSLVSLIDRESEDVATEVLQQQLPDVPVLREESGWTEHVSSDRYVIWLDPVDGSRPALAGAATSTVIFTLYDRQLSEIAGVVIADPATGRIWSAATGEGTTLSYQSSNGRLTRTCRVWQGEMTRTSTLLVENFAGFARPQSHKQIFDNEGCIRLFSTLQSQVAIQNYGSNGYHHALVANGGERLVGAITTSIGGEWDCGGIRAVLEAGGCAQGLRVESDRSLSLQPALNPLDYDLVVVANNQNTLDQVVKAVQMAL